MAIPPRSPTTLNTPRNRALDIGTSRNGFPDTIPYNNVAGVPQDAAGGTYRDNVPVAGTAGNAQSKTGPADPNPIKK